MTKSMTKKVHHQMQTNLEYAVIVYSLNVKKDSSVGVVILPAHELVVSMAGSLTTVRWERASDLEGAAMWNQQRSSNARQVEIPVGRPTHRNANFVVNSDNPILSFPSFSEAVAEASKIRDRLLEEGRLTDEPLQL